MATVKDFHYRHPLIKSCQGAIFLMIAKSIFSNVPRKYWSGFNEIYIPTLICSSHNPYGNMVVVFH